MRADQFLVSQGYFESRAKAQAAIKAGKVKVNGALIRKASQSIPDGAQVQAEAAYAWVSRAGLKLQAALEHFKISVSNRICLDIGASTGGFSDVLLTNGAQKIYAIDVGSGQLHPKLAADPRLISMEKTDARQITPDMFDPLPDMIVCDASFISLSKVIERPLSLMPDGSEAILLFKPQFEVGPDHISKAGIVKHPQVSDQAFCQFQLWLSAQGWTFRDSCPSPIKGGDGNVEFLCYGKKL